MSDFLLARALHVLGVVMWIGGVAFVTLVLLPALRARVDPQQRVAFFERIESGFARQARWTTLVTGISGFYLVYRLDAWERFAQVSFWWMHAMVAVWAIFTVMLFVIEPLWLHEWFLTRARRDLEPTFRMVERLHWLLLVLSLVTVAGAAAGSHGWLWM
ncbi:MAG TPA: hypothetical protein VNM24_11590 [Burkholderiales bacterium]|jgi:uncharacterized membrane protein|nr:hypothetical protein [Burkholderiales bacterium]